MNDPAGYKHAQEPYQDPAHATAWELLPWYHQDTLDHEEASTVHRHLGQCLICRQELRRLDRLEAAVNVPLHEHASQQAYARLAERLEGRAAARGWISTMLAQLRSAFAPAPLIAGTALLVLSSVLTGFIVMSGQSLAPTASRSFETLGQSGTNVGSPDYPVFRVVLNERAGSDLDPWLARYRGQLLDGPTSIGVLTVRVPMGKHSFDETLAKMRKDQDTLFVEPVHLIGNRPDRRRP